MRRAHAGLACSRMRGKCHAERARSAERGRAPHCQRRDRVAELVDRRALDEAELAGQCALIDQAHPPPPPLDRGRDRVHRISWISTGNGRP